ncbi:hypothetical protein AAFF_G00295180 [Aldrovandia affinis]|uniref:Transcription factor HES-5 n=1 Tax=Aldrovandia affinis TaxID=143900 RepID=A0AAD7R961_9TELE|nr:hypothetical protein AAFF_G00295180 [Aldrovandia affinis]
MAPSTLHRPLTEGNLSLSEKNRVRKPIVEKMRRDRINGSIEHLKTLLQRQLKQQQPGSKLEKADILEMAVNFLKQQVKPSADLGYRQGFSQCLEEARRYLLHTSLRLTDGVAVEHCPRTTTKSRTSAESIPKSTLVSLKQSAAMPQGIMWRPW